MSTANSLNDPLVKEITDHIYDLSFKKMKAMYYAMTRYRTNIDLFELASNMYSVYMERMNVMFRMQMSRSDILNITKDELFAEQIELEENSLGVVCFFLISKLSTNFFNVERGCDSNTECEDEGLVSSVMHVYERIVTSIPFTIVQSDLGSAATAA